MFILKINLSFASSRVRIFHRAFIVTVLCIFLLEYKNLENVYLESISYLFHIGYEFFVTRLLLPYRVSSLKVSRSWKNFLSIVPVVHRLIVPLEEKESSNSQLKKYTLCISFVQMEIPF